MKFKVFSICMMVIGTLLMSCVDDNDVTSDYGRLSVKLTDAPFPHDLVAEANVTIFKIEARYKGDVELEDSDMTVDDSDMETDDSSSDSESDDYDDDDNYDDDSKKFIVLMEDEVSVNLLDLTNGITENLVNAEVPVGSYDLVRVYVKGVNVVLTDGTTFDLKVPSGSQTGIKIFIDPELMVKGGLTSDLLLDFDVSKSFVVKGDSKDLASINGFNFKPVIKASNLSTAGTLMGNITETVEEVTEGDEETVEEVTVGVEGVQVTVLLEDTEVISTFTDADGGYMIMGLEAGIYTVVVEKEGYIMQSFDEVKIDAANKTVKDIEMEQEALTE